MKIFTELKRRNVFKIAIAYALVGWVLMQVAAVAFPPLGLPAWSQTLVVVLVLMGLPIAMLLAWAFEITPEGVKRTKEVDKDKSIAHTTGRKIDFAIIGVLVLVVGFLLYDNNSDAPSPAVTEAQASIAVLPFADMSPDGDQEYFSDGISEELLNVLAQIPDLRVAARTSSFQFKGINKDISDIGEQLNVAHVLEGSIRKAGTTLRITAQLIDVDGGHHIWSGTYDRQLTDVFAIQDEISEAIVAALKEKLNLDVAMAPKVQTTSTEAYEEYLVASQALDKRGSDNLYFAIEHFKSAIALDPTYAPAYARLAMAIILLEVYSGDLHVYEQLAEAKPYLDLAIALAPNLPDTKAAKAYYFWIDDRLPEADEILDKLIVEYPNYSLAYHWSSMVKEDLGNYQASVERNLEGLKRDPLSSLILNIAIINYISKGEIDEHLDLIERMRSLLPWRYYLSLAYVGLQKGEMVDATIKHMRVLENNSSTGTGIFFGHNLFKNYGLYEEALLFDPDHWPSMIKLGKTDEVIAAIESYLNTTPEGSYIYYDLKIISAGIEGRYDEALGYAREIWAKFKDEVVAGGGGAVNYAELLKFHGHDDEANEVARLLLADLDKRAEAGVMQLNSYIDLAQTHVVLGNVDEAKAIFNQEIERGNLPFIFENNLSEWSVNPEYADIVAKMEEKRSMLRAELLSIICIDNPYPEVWTPMEATCAPYVEGSGS